MKKKKGFTLTELLVVVLILGIIAGISIPLIRNLTTTFEKRKYQSYAESVLHASKLYTDAYSADLFGHNKNGCCYVDYEKLVDKNLLKDIEIDGISCNSSMTYVRVIKQGDKYGYKTFVSCGIKKNGFAQNISVTIPSTVPAKNYSECTCENTANLSVSADMTEAPKNIKKSKKKTKIIITSGTGINSNISISAGWSQTPDDFNGVEFNKVDFKTPDNQQDTLLNGDFVVTKSQEYLYTPDGEGEYYLIARVDQLSDLDGNQWKHPDNIDSKYVVLGPFIIYDEDAHTNSDIKLKIENPTDGEWTKNDLTLGISAESVKPIENFYSTFNANEANWPVMAEGVGKDSFTKTYTGTQNKQLSVKVCDIVGNCDSKNTRIKIDQTSPTTPVITNPSENKWAQSVELTITSSDAHSGIYGYYYSYSNADGQRVGDNPEENWVLIGGQGQNKVIKTFAPEAGEELIKTVYIKVLDNVKNASQVSSTVIKLDKKPPVKPVVKNPKEATWSTKKYNITITSSDSGSGIWRYYYSYKTVTSTSFSNWTVLNDKGCTGLERCVDTWSKDRNEYVSIMVCDNVKNCSQISKSKIQIDTTPPTCKVSKSNTKKTTGVTTSITCSDAMSGVKTCPSGQKGLKTEKKYTYTVTDKAGNTGSCSTTVDKYNCNCKTKCSESTLMTSKETASSCKTLCSKKGYNDYNHKIGNLEWNPKGGNSGYYTCNTHASSTTGMGCCYCRKCTKSCSTCYK